MPKLTKEELAQIGAVQRRAEEQEQKMPKLTEEELAQIEAVQRRAQEQQNELPSVSTSSADSSPSPLRWSTEFPSNEHFHDENLINEDFPKIWDHKLSPAPQQDVNVIAHDVQPAQKERTIDHDECSSASSSLSTSGADSVRTSAEHSQLYEPSTPLLLSEADMDPFDAVVDPRQQPPQKEMPNLSEEAVAESDNALEQTLMSLNEDTEFNVPLPEDGIDSVALCQSVQPALPPYTVGSVPMPKGVLTNAKPRQSSLGAGDASCSVMLLSQQRQQRWLSLGTVSDMVDGADDARYSIPPPRPPLPFPLMASPDGWKSTVTEAAATDQQLFNQCKQNSTNSTTTTTTNGRSRRSSSSCTSSVNVMFTDQRLRRSFCVDREDDGDQLMEQDDDGGEQLRHGTIIGAINDNRIGIGNGDNRVQQQMAVDEANVAKIVFSKDEQDTEVYHWQQQQQQQMDWANNVDFMCKLNFFAQRLSEEIAEEAARDITNIIQIQQNPRALYFDDKYCQLLKDGPDQQQQICPSSPETVDGWDGAVESFWPSSAGQNRADANDREAEPLLFKVHHETDKKPEEEMDEAAARAVGFKQELISGLNAFAGLMRRGSAAATATPTISARPWSSKWTPFLAPRATSFSTSTTTTSTRSSRINTTNNDNKRKGSAGGTATGETNAPTGTGGGGIMELLRRPSNGGTPKECAAAVAEELPESALAGLSKEEREHILRVVAESRRSPSGQASRSSSCSVHVRSEHGEGSSRTKQLTKAQEAAEEKEEGTTTAQSTGDDQQRNSIDQPPAEQDGEEQMFGEPIEDVLEVEQEQQPQQHQTQPEQTLQLVHVAEQREQPKSDEHGLMQEVQDVVQEVEERNKNEHELLTMEAHEQPDQAKQKMEDGHDERGTAEASADEASVLKSESQHDASPLASFQFPNSAKTVGESAEEMPIGLERSKEMAKPAPNEAAGWLNLFTAKVEKRAKQIGTSMPTISTKMEQIKRTVDMQSLSDQFKWLRGAKEGDAESVVDNQKPAEIFAGNGAIKPCPMPSASADPSTPDFWSAAHDFDGTVDGAKNTFQFVADSSRSSSSGIGDSIDENRLNSIMFPGTTDSWHEEQQKQRQSAVEQTARFVANELNMYREQLERMDSEMMASFSSAEKHGARNAICSPQLFVAETAAVFAPISTEIVDATAATDALSQPIDSAAAVPQFSGSIGGGGGGDKNAHVLVPSLENFSRPEKRIEDKNGEEEFGGREEGGKEGKKGMAPKEEERERNRKIVEGRESGENGDELSPWGREEEKKGERRRSARNGIGADSERKLGDSDAAPQALTLAQPTEPQDDDILAYSLTADGHAVVHPTLSEYSECSSIYLAENGAGFDVELGTIAVREKENSDRMESSDEPTQWEDDRSAAGRGIADANAIASSGSQTVPSPFSGITVSDGFGPRRLSPAATTAPLADANPFSLPQFPRPAASIVQRQEEGEENQKTKQNGAIAAVAFPFPFADASSSHCQQKRHNSVSPIDTKQKQQRQNVKAEHGTVDEEQQHGTGTEQNTNYHQQRHHQFVAGREHSESRVPTPFVGGEDQPQRHQQQKERPQRTSSTEATHSAAAGAGSALPRPPPPLPPKPSSAAPVASATAASSAPSLNIGKMFFSTAQKPTVTPTTAFAGFGNKFGKFASETLKGAKQAKEMAVTAMAQAGQTLETAMTTIPTPPQQDGQAQLLQPQQQQQVPQRPHSSLGLFSGTAGADQQGAGATPSPPNKSASLYDIALPPGFDQLSEEEQLRIISVMQCAELDAQMDAAQRAQQAVQPPAPPLPGPSVLRHKDAVDGGTAAVSNVPTLPAKFEPPQLENLADQPGQHERREDVEETPIELAVEVRAEEGDEEEEKGANALGQAISMDASTTDQLDLARYGHPVGIFQTETEQSAAEEQAQTSGDGGETGKEVDEKRHNVEEDDEPWMQPPTQKFTAPLDQWDDLLMKTVTQRKQLWTTVFTEDTDQQQQHQPNAVPQTGGAVTGPTREVEDEDELLAQISVDTVRGCWEQSNGDAIATHFAKNKVIGVPDQTGQQRWQQQQEEEGREDELAKVARSIYTTNFRAESQPYDVSREREEGGREMVKHRRIADEHAHSNSYEIEMEDPLSPSLCSPSNSVLIDDDHTADTKSSKVSVAHPMPPIITVTTPTDDTGSGEDSEEEEEEEEVEMTDTQRRRPSSSSSEEEEDGDYPDTVQPVPTVSAATIAHLQEQQEMEQQKMAAQVLQQIQAFGEAADDEFDVQWAKPKQQQPKKKVSVEEHQMNEQPEQQNNFFLEDQANVYSPPEAEEASAKPNVGIIKGSSAGTAQSSAPVPTAAVGSTIQRQGDGIDGGKLAPGRTTIVYRQHQQKQQQQQKRTNPFLSDEDGALLPSDGDEEEEEAEEESAGAGGHEAGDGIVIRQVLLDADDHSQEELERYYRTHFDHSIYFTSRPGKVYPIEETEEEQTVPNREGIYYAERIERKPLHSETMPPLASALRRKSTDSSSSRPTTAVPSRTETPTFDAIVAAPTTTAAAPSSADDQQHTSTAPTALSAHLTPIRAAPPPPDSAGATNVGQQSDRQDQSQMAPAASVDIPLMSSSVATPPAAKPLSAAIHLQQQLQQLNQHKFDTNIAQPNDLSPPQWHSAPTTAAEHSEGEQHKEQQHGGGGSAATASHRLKRSPAMILTGQCDSNKMPNGHFLTHAEDGSSGKVRYEVSDTHAHHSSSSSFIGRKSSLSSATKSTTTPAATTTTEHHRQQSVPPTSVASEMGRRRLPSLPTVATAGSAATASAAAANYYAQMAPSTASSVAALTRLYHATEIAPSSSTSTTAPGLVTYYTSSAPEKCDAAVNGKVPCSSSLSDSRVLFDLGAVAYAQAAALGPAPSSSSSWGPSSSAVAAAATSTADGLQQYQQLWQSKGPVVIPGALYNVPSFAASPAAAAAVAPVVGSRVFAPTSTASASYLPSSSVGTLSPQSSGSLPRRTRALQQKQQCRSISTLERANLETHAMLKFKQELRQALAQRRQQLDLCDIEAGHREYVINKWLHTGILPSRHRSDADAVPPVVKCTLPTELLANVGRIVPPSQHGVPSTARYGTPTATASFRPKRTTAEMPMPTDSRQSSPSPVGTRTFGCQTGDGTSSPVILGKQRQLLPHKPAMPATLPLLLADASTQTALCAETQTEPLSAAAAAAFDGVPVRHAVPTHQLPRDTTYYWPHPQEEADEERVGGASGDSATVTTTAAMRRQHRQQQRHRSRLARFLHTDTAEWERQLRERQLQQELDMRRTVLQQQQQQQRQQQQQHTTGTAQFGYNHPQQQQQPWSSTAASAWHNCYGNNSYGNQQRYWTGSLPRLDHHRVFPYGDNPYQQQQLPISSFWPESQASTYQHHHALRHGYSSLPRNYERSWAGTVIDRPPPLHHRGGSFVGGAAPSPAFVDSFGRFSSPMAPAQQSFAGPYGGNGTALHRSRYSKSVQELNRFGGDFDYCWSSPSWGSAYNGASAGVGAVHAPLSRSVNCLDRLGRTAEAYDSLNEFRNNGLLFNRRRTAPRPNGGDPMMSGNNGKSANLATMDDMGMAMMGQQNHQQQQQQQQNGAARATTVSDPNNGLLLSNYANFLNNQFMAEQQRQREADDREMMLGMSTTAATMMAPEHSALAQPPLEDERGPLMGQALPLPVMLEHPVLLQHQVEAQQCQQLLSPVNQQHQSNLAPAPPPSHYLRSEMALSPPAGPPPFLYSRGLDGEHNYGVRPPADRYEDYGNVHWRNCIAGGMKGLAEEQPYFGRHQQDWMNNNSNSYNNMNCYSNGRVANHLAYGSRTAQYNRQQRQPQILPMSTMASLVQQPHQPQFYSAPPPQTSRFSWPYQSQRHNGGMELWPSATNGESQQQQQRQHHMRQMPHGILRRPRNSPPFPMRNNSNNNDNSWSYGEMNNSTRRAAHSSNIKAPRVMTSAADNWPPRIRTSAETKRILLTRHYKHENIFKDLGIRIVGGKKLSNGDLGAFITKIDSSKAQEMLGQLREGDQILEWNGVLLSGKTFEEVERVIQASNLGEIELIVRSRRNFHGNGELDADDERDNVGDECQQLNGGRIMAQNGSDEFAPRQASTTRKNIAFAESTKNGASWHSPNEPPPIPAHRPQSNGNNNHDNSEWTPAEISWSATRNSARGDGRKTPHGQLTPPPAQDDSGGRHQRQRSAGHLQVAIAYDRHSWVLSVRLIAAHGLATCGQQMPNPFIKVYLLPERKVSNKRRTKYVPATCNPIWDQLVEYTIAPNQLERHYLEFTVIDYDRQTTDLDSRVIGQVHVGLTDPSSLNGIPRWLALQCPTSVQLRGNSSPFNMPSDYQMLPTKTYYNPAALDLLDGYPAIA